MRNISERPIALGISFILLMLLLATPAAFADDPETDRGKEPKVPRKDYPFIWHLNGHELSIEYPEGIDEIEVLVYSNNNLIFRKSLTPEQPSTTIAPDYHGNCILIMRSPQSKTIKSYIILG